MQEQFYHDGAHLVRDNTGYSKNLEVCSILPVPFFNVKLLNTVKIAESATFIRAPPA